MMQRALYLHFVGRWATLFEVEARPVPVDNAQRDQFFRGEISREELYAGRHRARRIDMLMVRRSRRTVTVPTGAAPTPTLVPGEQDPVLFDVGDEPFTAPAGPVDDGDDGGLERFAVEIKVTRADFLQDIRNPDKQAPWRELAHRHAYAVPAGLVSRDQVPGDSGLIEVTFRPDGRATCRFTRNAPRTVAATPLPLVNVMDAFYRASRAEALTRGLVQPAPGIDGQDVEKIRAELYVAKHKLELATNEAGRQRERADAWRKRFGACSPPPCGTCGKPLRPVSRGRSRWDRGSSNDWDHATQEDHDACHAERKKRVLAAARDGAQSWELWVPGPEPADADAA